MTLTNRRILSLWLPLAVSFELMMLEGPSLQAAVGRLADTQVNLAAWGLTISLSLLVESPVIMLLGTSIALASDRPAWHALRRFTVALCAGCTALAALLAFTPLYDVVTGTLMRQPDDIRAAARPALKIMLLWTAAIGWRRACQGLLVKHGMTSMVSLGTLVRLCSVIITAVLLVRDGRLPGVQVAACAIMVGVIGEAIVTTFFARPAERELKETDSRHLTGRDIFRFHAPLAATTLLTLLAQPLTASALAWLPQAEKTLAAWPVAFMALLVIRGWGLALQEITVSRARDPEARAPLARFTVLVGLITSGVAAALAFTPLLGIYLEGALHVPLALQPEVGLGIGLCCLQPLITAMAAFTRGALMAVGATRDVYAGMGASLAAQIALLVLAVLLHLPGMWAAAIAFMGATLVEYGWLRRCALARSAL